MKFPKRRFLDASTLKSKIQQAMAAPSMQDSLKDAEEISNYLFQETAGNMVITCSVSLEPGPQQGPRGPTPGTRDGLESWVSMPTSGSTLIRQCLNWTRTMTARTRVSVNRISCRKVVGKASRRTMCAQRLKSKHTSTHGRSPRPRRQALTQKPSRGACIAISSDSAHHTDRQDHLQCPGQSSGNALRLMQLIRPNGGLADLDRKVEELIDVCIEHPHVRSVKLQDLSAGP